MDQAQVTRPAQCQQIPQLVASLFGPIDNVGGLDTQGTPAALWILAAIAVSIVDWFRKNSGIRQEVGARQAAKVNPEHGLQGCS
jgi:hypothetical protein